MYFVDGRLQDVTLTTFDETFPETIHSNTIYVNDTWFLLRVYSEGASILMLHGGNTLMVTQHKNNNSAYRIEHATSWQDEYGTYIAVCLLKEDESMLQILSIQDVSMEDNSNQIKLSIDIVQNMPLKACPSYIGYFYLKSTSLLAIGTYEHSLIIYSVQATNISMVQDIYLGNRLSIVFTQNLHAYRFLFFGVLCYPTFCGYCIFFARTGHASSLLGWITSRNTFKLSYTTDWIRHYF